MPAPFFIATWNFGKDVTEKAFETATSGHSMIQAIEQGIWVAESDKTNSTVGIGGAPNATGQVELDACIMSGPGHQAGSVAGIQDVLHPISVARKVMTDTPHVCLVGGGARKYALENGFQKTEMLTEKAKTNWKKWQQAQKKSTAPHQENPNDLPVEKDGEHKDTVALLGMDEDGNLFGGCSTSGWGYKIPGRVGDSPIIGSGLYVDNEIGAVGSTGTGENVMRWCASFWITQMMASGMPPVDACEHVIREIVRKDPLPIEKLAINFIAINKKGEFGAAGTNRGFEFATTDQSGTNVQKAKLIK